MDIAGSVLRQGRVENTLDKMREFSESVPAKSSMVIESSSTWYWAHRLLSERHDVMLSNPIRNKAIASAKVKTDKIDSITLANLLRGGWAAECYVPSKETMEFRELVRFRANLVRERTKLKNRIHAYLLMNNISVDARPFTKGFVEEVRKLDDLRVKSYLRLIDALNSEILEASTVIKQRAGSNEDANLLMTIPGVSFYSALLIVSEIGEIGRFEDSSSLVGYAGLAPSTHSSGGRTYHGPITKTGSRYLRWILGQCTRVHIRFEPDGTVAQFYARIARKKGDQKAIVAASAKLLKIVYWVLKERRAYHS
ncbi:MAG: IS110 family transposase [Nitrososphaerota archaeon]|nr:IS110 family transposase [Nitrososphaerota archaeon]